MNVQEFKQQYPEYKDMKDEALTASLYNKHYADKMDYESFTDKFLTKPDTEDSFIQKMQGQLSSGMNTVARTTVLDLPKSLLYDVRSLVNLGVVAGEKISGNKLSPEQLLNMNDIMSKPEQWLQKRIDEHKRGQEIIFEHHPEWRYTPPDSFMKLASNPEDLILSAASSIPQLVAAGILMKAAQPQLAFAMIYASEGNEAAEQVASYNGSQGEQEQARLVYGTIAAWIEQWQIDQAFKLTPKMYNGLLGLMGKKVIEKGAGGLTKDFLFTAGSEAVEEMIQGQWQETTVKAITGKGPGGGLKAWADRRAREGLIAFFLTGAVGAGAVTAGGIQGMNAKSRETSNIPTQENAVKPAKPMSTDETLLTQAVEESRALKEQSAYFKKNAKYKKASTLKASDSPLKTKQWAILTASNPNNQALSPEANAARNAKLTEDLEAQGYEAIPIKEKYGGNDKVSFLVPNLTSRKAFELGHKYGQESILTPEGLLYNDGTVNPADLSNVVFDNDAVDNYNVIQTLTGPVKFQIPIDFNTKTQSSLKSTKAQRSRGHILATQLGLSEGRRRNFNTAYGENASLKDMTIGQASNVIKEFENRLMERGIEPLSTSKNAVQYLVETIHTKNRIEEKPDVKGIEEEGIYKLISNLKKSAAGYHYGQIRIQRLLEQLDGYEDGPNVRFVWEPTRKADNNSNVAENERIDTFVTKIWEILGGKKGVADFFKNGPQNIEGVRVPLRSIEKIGVYLHSFNQNQRRHITLGNGFTNEEINRVTASLTPQEKAIGDYMLESYEAQYARLAQVYLEVTGKELQKEDFYAAIRILKDVDLNTKTDFLTELADNQQVDIPAPESGVTKTRVKASQPISLNAFSDYLNNISRTERYIQMAPVARSVGKILSDTRYKQAVDDATQGQGSKIFKKWFSDTVKGFNKTQTDWIEKSVLIVQKNAIIYAIGLKLASMMRAGLSLSNAIAANPKMMITVPQNLTNMMKRGGFRQLKNFVYSRSNEMRVRHFDRYQDSISQLKGAKRRIMRKHTVSEAVMSTYRFVDSRTTLLSWKSLYDVAQINGLNETESIRYADTWASKTQPMGRIKDLPHFFRGGALEKLITIFQNQINNNYNFWSNDIIGAKRADAISNTQVAHRVLFSYIIPSLVYGMIGRARPPKSWGEVGFDLITYPLAAPILIGRIVMGIVQGYGFGSVATIPIEEAAKAVKSKTWPTRIKHGAKAVAAATGTVPDQVFITGEGLYDLATDETDDPRRLFYTEWALNKGKEANDKREVMEGSTK